MPKDLANEKEVTIESKLEGKTAREKADLKGEEIVKVLPVGEHVEQKDNVEIKIEVLSIEKIEGGVQVFARAWKNGEQLGFGQDGSVDIERFRFINPPVLVPDPMGDIIRDELHDDIKTKQVIVRQRRLREDPKQALLDSLRHTISLVGKTGTDIQVSKVGNTTTTLYPAAGANSPCDGLIGNNNATYATAQSAATGNSASVTNDQTSIATNYLDAGQYYVRRAFFGFDFTSIGSDEITSAILSITGNGVAVENTNTCAIRIFSGTPAANNTLSTADFDAVGSTHYASINLSSWVSTDNSYNDFTLDAAGLAYVNGFSGVGFLVTRLDKDVSASVPTGGNECQGRYADTSGTSSDPKLVLVHSAAVTTVPSMATLGVGA